MTIYLTAEDLLVIGEHMMGQEFLVRDYGLLEAAAHRPQSTAFGEDAYQTLHHKAAALLHSLVSNHALVDGNERLGWAACLIFYDLNGYAADEDVERHTEFVVAIADGSLHEVDDIAGTLVTWVQQKPDAAVQS